MSTRYEKYYAKMVAALQPHCEGPIRGVLAVQHAGSWGAVGLAQVSGASYLLQRRRNKQRAGGLPANCLLALTDGYLHAFGYKPRGFGVKVKGIAASWDRRDLQLHVQPRDLTYLLTLTTISTGQSVQLEATSAFGGREWIDRFFALLGTPTAPPPTPPT